MVGSAIESFLSTAIQSASANLDAESVECILADLEASSAQTQHAYAHAREATVVQAIQHMLETRREAHVVNAFAHDVRYWSDESLSNILEQASAGHRHSSPGFLNAAMTEIEARQKEDHVRHWFRLVMRRRLEHMSIRSCSPYSIQFSALQHDVPKDVLKHALWDIYHRTERQCVPVRLAPDAFLSASQRAKHDAFVEEIVQTCFEAWRAHVLSPSLEWTSQWMHLWTRAAGFLNPTQSRARRADAVCVVRQQMLPQMASEERSAHLCAIMQVYTFAIKTIPLSDSVYEDVQTALMSSLLQWLDRCSVDLSAFTAPEAWSPLVDQWLSLLRSMRMKLSREQRGVRDSISISVGGGPPYDAPPTPSYMRLISSTMPTVIHKLEVLLEQLLGRIMDTLQRDTQSVPGVPVAHQSWITLLSPLVLGALLDYQSSRRWSVATQGATDDAKLWRRIRDLSRMLCQNF
jgi:hypothetical protein